MRYVLTILAFRCGAREAEGFAAMKKTSGTVLLVDPDAETRTAARDALRRSGYETREVETGADAVKAAQSGGIAIVLLEVSLPDVTGYEICRDLRTDHGEELPIFFLSGTRTEPLDRVAGLLLGADDYIVKPFDANELVARVGRFVVRGTKPPRRRREDRSDLPHLTDREYEVLERLAGGERPKAIAQALTISPKTVATHVQNLLRKFEVHSRAELVARAFALDFVRRS